MNCEELPRGEAPKGSSSNSGKIDHSFFKANAEVARDDSLRTHMPFLHAILYSKLETAIVAREIVRKKKKQAKEKAEVKDTDDGHLNDAETNGLDSMRRRLDASSVEDMERISHSETISAVDVEHKQLVQVSLSSVSVLQRQFARFELMSLAKHPFRSL